MDMLKFYRGLDRNAKAALSEELCTSRAYLSQIAYGHRHAGPAFAKRIELATDGVVTRYDLRPDIFDPPATASQDAE